VDRAADLIKGGYIPGTSLADEIAACAEEAKVLFPAIQKLRQELADIVADRSFEICRRYQQENAQHHRALLDAMVHARAAADAILGLRARLTGAGYRVNEHALPGFLPNFVYALGAAGYGGQIDQFRHFIEEKKL
jgi:hypothetical protein